MSFPYRHPVAVFPFSRRGADADAVPRGPRQFAMADVVTAVVISVIGVLIVLGAGLSGTAATGMLLVGMPILLRSRHPVLAAALYLGLGIWLNGWLFGGAVRCGAQLPAMGYLTFAVARNARGPRWATLAVFAVTFLAGEFVFDPVMHYYGGIPIATAVAVITAVAGDVVRRQYTRMERLRQATLALQAQRERSEQAAAEAERLRIGADVVAAIRSRLDRVLDDTAAAQRRVGHSDMVPLLRGMEETARAGLDDVRHALGWLRAEDLPERTPAPGLAQLPDLLAARGHPRAVHTEGQHAPVPAMLELTIYRLVEQLLDAVETGRSPVEVHICFQPDILELRVDGPRRGGAVDATLPAVEARAMAFGGTVSVATSGPRLRATTWLPLIPAGV